MNEYDLFMTIYVRINIYIYIFYAEKQFSLSFRIYNNSLFYVYDTNAKQKIEKKITFEYTRTWALYS